MNNRSRKRTRANSNTSSTAFSARGRSRTRTPSSSRSRSRSMASSRSSRSVTYKKNSYAGRQSDKGDGTNVTATYSAKKGRSVAKEARPKKKVKVSPELRKKIKKVLEKDVGAGWYKSISYPGSPIVPLDNAQVTAPLNTGNVASGGGWAFAPTQVHAAASVLFSGYQPTAPDHGTSSVFNFGFPIDTLKVHMLESNVIYRLKNNTRRTMTLKIYDVSPKSANDTLLFPVTVWQNVLAQEVPDAVSYDGGVNVLTNTINTLTNSPKVSPSYGKAFSIDETIVTLEPGKEYNHKLNGPKDFMYDFSKYFINGTFSNYQKMMKGSFVCMYTDLTSATGADTIGRFTDMVEATPGGYGLLVETTQFFRIKLPEQAGVRIPVAPLAGASVPMSQRKDNVYAINVFSNTVGQTIPIVISDEQPLDPNPTTGV